MSGVLNKALTTNAVQLVGTVPGTTYSCVNIVVSNPLAVDAEMQLWISTSNTPSTVDMVEPIVIIPSNGRYEQTARICSAGENIFVKAAAGCVIRVETVDEVLS